MNESDAARQRSEMEQMAKTLSSVARYVNQVSGHKFVGKRGQGLCGVCGKPIENLNHDGFSSVEDTK